MKNLNITEETICTNGSCPAKENCYRYQLSTKLDKQILCVSMLNHSAIETSEMGCEQMLTAQILRVAYGFKRMQRTIPKENGTYLYSKLGIGGTVRFYEYRNGKRRILPQMQEYIKSELAKLGADTSMGFDSYREETVLMRVTEMQ